MGKYKIIPSSRTIVHSPISIGHKAEKGVEAIEFDLTAWVETYGSGTLTVIMWRWGDAIPYPIALEIDENNKATWTLSDTDTAKAGMAYAQLNYIVGETVVKKSDIYTFRVMDSLTGEGEPPEAYESWLEHLTHLAAEAMAEVLDIEGVVTDKTLTVDGGIADAKKTGDEISALKADLGAVQIADELTDYTIEQGTINATDGSNGSSLSTNRARTGFIFFDGDKLNVVPKEGYAVGGRIYSGNSIDSFVSSDAFTTDQLEYTNANYYRFVIKKVDGSDIPVQSLPDDVITITYYSNTDKTLSIDGKIADARAVGKRIKAIESEQQGIVGRNNRIETVALLQQLNRKTRISGSTYGKKPLCFIHFSDIHGDAACLANVIEFKTEYSSYISDILHTGDAVHYSSVDGMDFWNSVDGSENVLNVIGNHDTKLSQSGDWTGLSMAESYSAYFAPYISNWGVSYTADKTYYYKDYTTESVRLIVLDIMHQTAEQLSWFVSTLESARTAGLDVVVGVHSRAHWLLDTHDGVWDDKINSPSYSEGYSDTSAYTGSNYPSNLADDYASAVDDFIEAGGYFIAWLHGHTHFRILADLQTHPNQLDIAVANAGGSGFAHTHVWERVVDTKSMDDFNVVGIDTTGKILRIAKIGVNTDRLMRVAHTMSYNYQTHTIINAS